MIRLMFDPESFCIITGNDPETGREIADLFRSDTSQLLKDMQAAIGAGDAEVVKRLGHTLKSTCAAVGATQASSWGAAIEQGGVPVAEELLPQLAEHLPEIFDRLDQTAEEMPAA